MAADNFLHVFLIEIAYILMKILLQPFPYVSHYIYFLNEYLALIRWQVITNDAKY